MLKPSGAPNDAEIKKGVLIMKKSRMKKWSALVLALLMLLSQIVAVSAEETNSDDAEYELAVAAIMRDYWNDPEGTVSRLAELDTELVGRSPSNGNGKYGKRDFAHRLHPFRVFF